MGTSACATRMVLHTEQCFPSVRPVAVQVGATALSITSLCPSASITSCSTSTLPQTLQCFPCVSPVSVQVGATALSITSVCPSASTASCSTSTSPQTSQCFPCVSPVSVQVGATALSITSLCPSADVSLWAIISPQCSQISFSKPVSMQVGAFSTTVEINECKQRVLKIAFASISVLEVAGILSTTPSPSISNPSKMY